MKKIQSLLSILLFGIFHFICAQNSQLIQKIDNWGFSNYSPDPQANLFCIGNITQNVIIGTQNVNLYGVKNGIVAKIDTTGAVHWITNLQDPIPNQTGEIIVISILYTSLNELWVCGQIKDTAIINSQLYTMTTGYRSFFIQLDPITGSILQVDVASNQFSSTLSLMKEDHNGNIIFTGGFEGQVQFSNFTIGGTTPASYFVKIDPSRNLIWQLPLSTTAPNIRPGITSIHCDGAGNIISSIESFNAPNLIYGTNNVQLNYQNNLNHYMVLSKMGPTGQLLWQKQFDGFCDIKVEENESGGNFYIYGYVDSLAIYQNTQLISQYFTNDLFIAKLDPNGNFIWHKIFGGGGDDEITSIKKDLSGKIIFGGFFLNGFIENNITLLGNKGNFTSILGSIDTLGNINWITQGSQNPINNHITNLYISPGNNILTFTSFINLFTIAPPYPNYIFWGVSTLIQNNCQLIHFLRNNLNYITGKIFVDSNNNGILDLGETGVKNIRVDLSSGNFCAFTNSTGDYSLLAPAGSHSIQLNAPPGNYSVTTSPLPFVNFIGGGQSNPGNDIGISSPSGINDLSVNAITVNRARYHLPLVYIIEYKNEGSQAQNVSVNFTVPAQLNFVQSNPIPNTISGTTYSWFIPNLLPLQSGQIEFVTNFTPLNYNWGDTIFSTASITPVLNDGNPQNNQYEDSTRIFNPYDPNFKTVNKEYLTIEEINGNCWLNYIIHFQNLGNDTAFNVVIRDTLSNWIQLPYIEITGSSDPVELEVDSLGRAAFKFFNIMLPDSGTDFSGSCGFVKYRALLKSGLQSGDNIENLADIYFDYMPPIRTNTATTTITYPTSINNSMDLHTLKTFPNPVGSEGFQVEWPHKGESGRIEIYSVAGVKILEKIIEKDIDHPLVPINLPNITGGIYFGKVFLNNGIYNFKIIRESE